MSLWDQIWPRRGSTCDINPAGVFQNYRNAVDMLERGRASNDDSKLLADSWKLFDNDKERRNSIDGRAGALMPAIGLAAALVTGVGFSVMRQVGQLPTDAKWVIGITYLLSLIYLMRTTWLLFLVHGPIVRYTPDPSDLQTPSGKVAVSYYDRRLACKVLNYTIENYRQTNLQMDTLRVAQLAFRNGVAIIVAGGVVGGAMIFFEIGAPLCLN